MTEQSYEVLYYKRASANKVHRQRGVATMDGILTVQGERVTLRMAGDDQCSSDEEENAKKNWKRGKSKASSSVYSGIQRDIAKRTLNLEDTIVLGGYEVQIGSIVTATNDANNALAISSIPLKKPPTMIVKKPVALLGKRKLAPGFKSKGLVSKRVAPLQSTIKRATPLQPKQPIKFNPSNPLQRKIATSHQTSEPGTTISSSLKNNADAVLPHIPLATSIRAVLRPHQVTGVDFLWKTLHETNGCILGDEMGLGVST